MGKQTLIHRHSKRLTDPTLREIRKARIAKDDAEVALAKLCIAALDNGFSYRQISDAALSDKGSMHYFVGRFRKRLEAQRPNSKTMPPPADVEA